MRVLATAGHVDHGKSTLVLALTGTDPDRLAEEKARGLTIDLGFASTEEYAFVDVPGHVRFLKNMLAGVGAVDACLFVVAATEGWKPQSEEHLRVLELLGVSHGVIALTKVDLVDDDRRAMAELEVQERVTGTFLDGAPIVGTDGVDMSGLRAALRDLVSATPAAADTGRARMWIDRSFAVKGAGTVVTGTLAGGRLTVGDEVLILPGETLGRIRQLHSHYTQLDVADPGRRVAVNIAGVSHDAAGRGQALVHPDQWHRTRIVDASLEVLGALDHPVDRRGAYTAYMGSGEFPVRLRVLQTDDIKPGSTGLVRLHLPVDLPLQPGDRYVLREAGRQETVGGGEVLDVAPVLPASRAQPSRSIRRVVAERGWVDAALLGRLVGAAAPPAPTVGRWVVDPDVLARTRNDLVARVHSGDVSLAALSDKERAVVAGGLSGVTVRDGYARADGADELSEGARAAHDLLVSGRFAPAPISPVKARELARAGLALQCGDIWFAASALDDAAQVVARLLHGVPQGVTVSDVRAALGTSRKYAVPLLEHFDTTGVTRRRGDVRIAGPRLPATE